MNSNICPNGYICINHFNAILLVLAFIFALYFVNDKQYKTIFSKISNIENNKKTISNKYSNNQDNNSLLNKNNYLEIQNNKLENKYNSLLEQTQNIQNQRNKHHDLSVVSNPLYPPLQRHVSNKTLGIPINIETRESGGDFQQLGMLSKDNIKDDTANPGNNTDSVILPLYGKPTYKGSSKWLYYTETDKYNPVKIPISVNNLDCTDDMGCNELSNGDNVSISSYNGLFNVKIYKFNKPRYIPFI